MPAKPEIATLEEPILVLGATSLIGRFLTPRLAAMGVGCVALSRDPPADSPHLAWIRGHLNDPDFKPPPVRTVLSLAPIWLLPPALPALTAAGMRRLVAFSSTSRFTKTASPDAGEREVAQRLAAAEASTIAICEAGHVAWTLLRPTLIYAEGQDRNVTRLARLIARWRFLPLSGAAQGLRQPVHADDLAAGALAASSSPAAVGQAYDLPGGETLAYRAMVERLFEAQDLPPRILSVPPPLWRAVLRLAAPVMPGATTAMGDRMAEDLTFDPAPAMRDLGWNPRSFRPRF